jgi:hypothetical protein
MFRKDNGALHEYLAPKTPERVCKGIKHSAHPQVVVKYPVGVVVGWKIDSAAKHVKLSSRAWIQSGRYFSASSMPAVGILKEKVFLPR